MKKVLVFLALIVLFHACAIIHTPGFNSGYKRLPTDEQGKICFVSSVDEIPDQNNGKIMAITANQLSVLLARSGNTLLYLWSPHCSSTVCIPLKTIQDFCDSVNLNLYVLTEYYTDALLQNEFLSRPMLSVNEFYYKTSYCNSYMKRFLSELIPNDQLQSVSHHRFLLFSNEHLVQSYEKIEDIIP